MTFWETKNGKARRIPISPAIAAVLAAQPGIYPSVFANSRTGRPLTPNGMAHAFDRAILQAGITSGDVTLHTLRHTALSRMIASGYDDYTVMSISGHSSTRMLERYTHPTEERKIGALDPPWLGTKRAQNDEAADDDSSTASEIARLLKDVGGRQEDRTPDLRIANAALSQLSYRPSFVGFGSGDIGPCSRTGQHPGPGRIWALRSRPAPSCGEAEAS